MNISAVEIEIPPAQSVRVTSDTLHMDLSDVRDSRDPRASCQCAQSQRLTGGSDAKLDIAGAAGLRNDACSL